MTSKVINSIEIGDSYLNVPLYCIFGTKYSPQIMLCKISNNGGPYTCIWGYSKWEGEWGFRTLGIELKTWLNKNKMVEFFDSKEFAFDYLNKLMSFRTINI
jgi:hypothetical protein